MSGVSAMNASGGDQTGTIRSMRSETDTAESLVVATAQGGFPPGLMVADTGHGGQSQNGIGREGILDEESRPLPCKRFRTWRGLGRLAPAAPAAGTHGDGNPLGRTRTTTCLH